MKKIFFVLLLFVLVSIGNAKQFAYCYAFSLAPDNFDCWKQTSNDKEILMKNVKTAGQMYANGTYVYFYFEK